MTRGKKLLLGILLVCLLFQIPFAYRRYKLGRLHSQILVINAERSAGTDAAGFVEYTGVMHVHSFLGGHSRGSFEEIINAAKSNRLDFVVMTEHTSANLNTAAMTLKGLHAGVLFVNGNEVSAANSDRLLILPGDESAAVKPAPPEELAAGAKLRGALSIIAYPQDFKSANSGQYDGMEIYNVYTNAREINPMIMFFDALWSYHSYPELLFANFYSRPAENLRKWDEATASGKRMVAVAGNDAHANIGISVQDSSGKTLLGLQLDPYERSFRLVRVHVLLPSGQPLSAQTLLAAIAAGHCFIGFDLFGETKGFEFFASNGRETKIQGDEIDEAREVRFTVYTPVESRVVLLKNGQVVYDRVGGRQHEFVETERGTYRVEVYLPQLREPLANQPWMISNPIYVK